MCCENRVIWLDNRCGGLGSGVNAELQLALLAIVDGETLHQESSKTGSSSTTERVEDQETLETRAVIRNAANSVKNLINQLLANSVMATSIVVGSVLFASDHVLWVEKAAVGTSANLVDYIGLEIAVDGSRNILALTCAQTMLARAFRLLYTATYRSRRKKC